ncbi:MAG: sigma-70 family RNA polymerase sigma factor [Planctomycetes bacterium]|nr:sigma-70 family RNA polymerase sigma factor [Planctomycetota bacterium]
MLHTGESGEADKALLARVRRGDAIAVEAFVQRMACVPLILAAQNARLGKVLGPAQLDDAAQEVLTLIWTRLETFEGRSTLETWVYRFCVNTLMNAVRRERRSRRNEELSEEAADPTLVDAETRYTRYDHLYLGIAKLPAEERVCIHLKHFEERTFDEIGARLGISPNTAKTQYYRGLRRLQELLAREERETR